MAMADQLKVNTITDTAGEIKEGQTVALALYDGRVIVTRIRQIQTGPFKCPIEDCFRRFDSERGRKTHIGKMHPEERLRDCAGCGEVFQPDPLDQRYCSRDCYHERGRVTLTCAECGDEFSVKASHADERRHCSRACRSEAAHETRTCPTCDEAFEVYTRSEQTYCSRLCAAHDREHTREERTCPECCDTFEVYPSRDQQYCSRDCYSKSRREQRRCPMCGADFEVLAGNKHLDTEHCSRACYYESCRADERPDTPLALLEELRAEDHDRAMLVDRASAHLAPEWEHDDIRAAVCLLAGDDYEAALDDLQERLTDPPGRRALLDRLVQVTCRLSPDPPTHVGVREFEHALSEATTLYEASQIFRCSRASTRRILTRLGVRERVESRSEAALLEDVREQLGIDPDRNGDSSTDPIWKRAKRGKLDG